MNDKKRILVVEDERNISDFLKCGLEESGFDVSVAYDGNTAWQIITECMADNALHMLLLDVRMPGMSGLELCLRFREQYGFQTPILMLTALAPPTISWRDCMPAPTTICPSHLSLWNCWRA